MENNENLIPEEVSPKKKTKQEKIEANLAKRREKEKKTVILDNFWKRIIRTFVVVAFVAILVPFGAFTLGQQESIDDVSVESAIEYVTNAYKSTPKRVAYSYTVAEVKTTEVFVFTGENLTERETYSGDVKIVMRKPTIADSAYVKETYSGKTDAEVAEYISTNTTDYLIITYTKNASSEYIETSSSLSATNSVTFNAKGTTYTEIVNKTIMVDVIDDTTVTSAQAKTKYNIFGLGFTYKDYTAKFADDYIVFEGDKVVETYDFATDVKYTFSVTL